DDLRAHSQRIDGLARHAPERDRRRVPLEVRVRDRLEPREGQLVGAQRACQRMRLQSIDERAAADDDPRLWSTEELVTGEGDERRARFDALTHSELVAQPGRSLSQPW